MLILGKLQRGQQLQVTHGSHSAVQNVSRCSGTNPEVPIHRAGTHGPALFNCFFRVYLPAWYLTNNVLLTQPE